MSDTHSIRKLGGDKIALLGLFVMALLTARFVVGLRSAILLSEPIPLRRAGISVSVPLGNGWQSDGRWVRREGVLTLASNFPVGTGEPSAWILCRYLTTAEPTPTKAHFEREAARAKGVIVQIGEMQTERLIFTWARIEGQDMLVTMFVGIAVLPDGGQLDISVAEYTGDADQAERAFKSVVESVTLDVHPGMAA